MPDELEINNIELLKKFLQVFESQNNEMALLLHLAIKKGIHQKNHEYERILDILMDREKGVCLLNTIVQDLKNTTEELSNKKERNND